MSNMFVQGILSSATLDLFLHPSLLLNASDPLSIQYCNILGNISCRPIITRFARSFSFMNLSLKGNMTANSSWVYMQSLLVCLNLSMAAMHGLGWYGKNGEVGMCPMHVIDILIGHMRQTRVSNVLTVQLLIDKKLWTLT